MKIHSHKFIVVFLLIFILSFIMRFYNAFNFQYFSGDEEIFHAILRKIVAEGKPVLVVPNAQIGGSIGSFFHLLSSPIFFTVQSNPILVQLFGSALGVITTALMYLVGKEVAGRAMGLLASTLYGGSFLVSLFDRRWWPLTPDPLLILIAIFGLIKLSRKKYKYAILVAVAASSAWQADPTNAVILLGILIAFSLLRLPLLKKEYILALIYIFFSFIPFLVFEIRHPGTIFRPFLIHIVSKIGGGGQDINFDLINIGNIIENLSRSLFLLPSKFIEEYFCYCSAYPKPPLSPLPEMLVIFFVMFSIGWTIFSKHDKEVRNAMLIVLSFSLSFLVGISSYNVVLKFNTYQHYFVTVFPSFLLIVAFTLQSILKTRFAMLSWVFLIVFVVSNLNTVFNSSLRFPVWQKMEIVNKIISDIGNSTFSVYGYGEKYMTDGGWTTFFIRENSHPSRSYLNGGWDWIYRSHGLYTTNPDQGDGSKIIIFHDVNEDPFKGSDFRDKIETVQSIGNIKATVFDNEDLQKEFDIKKL